MDEFVKKCEEINEKIKSFGNNFIPDGVINPEKFVKAPLKLLWVLKDPNSNDLGWSMLEYLSTSEIKSKIGKKNKDTLKYQIYVRVLTTSYGILNKFPEFKHVISKRYDESLYSVSEQIAYINIKKSIGGSKVYDDELKTAYKEHRNLLLNQIKVASPDIIIFGNTFNLFAKDLGEIGWDLSNSEKYNSEIFTDFPNFYLFPDKKLIVHAYHPACRKSYEYYYEAIIEGIKLVY